MRSYAWTARAIMTGAPRNRPPRRLCDPGRDRVRETPAIVTMAILETPSSMKRRSSSSLPSSLRRPARRVGPRGPQPPVEGRPARLDPAGAAPRRGPRPGLRPRRDRQDRQPRPPRCSSRCSTRRRTTLPRRLHRVAVRPVRDPVPHHRQGAGADPARAAASASRSSSCPATPRPRSWPSRGRISSPRRTGPPA